MEERQHSSSSLHLQLFPQKYNFSVPYCFGHPKKSAHRPVGENLQWDIFFACVVSDSPAHELA